ncbi:MAG: SMI1/KNR4 family protein [Myxococcales bacterium]|nr:SMI1/KNR4 family protein [Myxococcales bacterium]
MNLEELERRHNIELHPLHREVLQDPDDPIHQACEMLLIESPNDLLDFTRVNTYLHSKSGRSWPDFLIAFATNGCGDYFAYDLRETPRRIVYIDLDSSVWEQLRADSDLELRDFQDWYDYELDG